MAGDETGKKEPKHTPSHHSNRWYKKHPEVERLSVPAAGNRPVGGGFSSWFLLEEPNKEPINKNRETLGLISDVVLAFVLGLVSMPVMLRWAGWTICWVLFVYFVLNGFSPMNRLPRKTQVLIGVLLLFAFVQALWGTAYSQWRGEKAAALEGDLFLASSHATRKLLEVGAGGAIDEADANNHILNIWADAALEVANDNGHLLFSTVVRDQQGKVVVSVEKNHWTVNPDSGICLDKNYTADTLEVKDGRGHIVLQVRLYPDRVRIEGEWFNDRGEDVMIIQNRERGGAQYVFKPKLYGPMDAIMIKPLFQYPSSKHWAEWVTRPSW